MAVREETLTVPTRENADTAAAVLAGEGAATVLLHGSVATGTARAGSDIDLVAVFDDIDYAERYPRRWRLEAKCSAAAGVPVEVHVTDWPEWRHRTCDVGSSFEASVARHAQTLLEREPQPGTVRWDKEIGMPDSNLAEAIQRMSDVCQSLGGMIRACRLDDHETRTVDGHTEAIVAVQQRRLRALCADASMTIENALKAWNALKGAPSQRTHSIAKLLHKARPLPETLEQALAPLHANTIRPSREPYDDVSSWRIGGTYPSALPQATPETTARLARLLARAAVVSADVTLERLLGEGADPDDETAAACSAETRRARSVLAAGDVVTGAGA